MLFNSDEFLLFFPIVVILYFIIPQRIRTLWLLICSYFFYMCWNAKYALLLLFSTLVTYVGGLLLEKIKQKTSNIPHGLIMQKFVLFAAISANLLILVFFKYTNFLINLINNISNAVHINCNLSQIDIILPVGISFYIFQALGYLIDVYRDDIYAEKNLIKYALFVSFFPQLVAGPIERSKNLLKQLDGKATFDYKRIRSGLLTMLWGLFLKLVIADRCSIIVNAVYSSYDNFNGLPLIVANILFAIQIYCDFMGYSTIAIGSAKVLGVNLMNNFSQPYFATSIKDFWRRWHISLSTWFRDYVYIPLGGNRCSKVRNYLNIFITFMISGLWHGANLTFVVWGIIHGIYQILEDMLKPFIIKINTKFNLDWNRTYLKTVRIVKTFILADIAWVFFRAETLKSAIQILVKSLKITSKNESFINMLNSVNFDVRNNCILIVAILILLLSSILNERKIYIIDWISSKHFVIRYAIYWGICILIILSLDIGGEQFIYFQF